MRDLWRLLPWCKVWTTVVNFVRGNDCSACSLFSGLVKRWIWMRSWLARRSREQATRAALCCWILQSWINLTNHRLGAGTPVIGISGDLAGKSPCLASCRRAFIELVFMASWVSLDLKNCGAVSRQCAISVKSAAQNSAMYNNDHFAVV